MGERKTIVLPSVSPASIDLALDSISATELEREVIHLVCKVNSPRSALRVVAAYRAEKHGQPKPEESACATE